MTITQTGKLTEKDRNQIKKEGWKYAGEFDRKGKRWSFWTNSDKSFREIKAKKHRLFKPPTYKVVSLWDCRNKKKKSCKKVKRK